MGDNSNKQAIIAAIWENPERAFNCRFKHSGKYLINARNDEYDEQGKIRLAQTRTGENIMVFYNGASREERTDVFTYLERYVLHTSSFKETIQRLAEIYGITLRYSEEQRRRMSRAALAREVCPSLIESLRTNPTGTAGRYITETRGLSIDAHFGELTAESLNRAKEHLRNRGVSCTAKEFNALFLTDESIAKGYTAEDVAKWGYNVVMPYYRNGNVEGFVFRNVKPDAKTRYLYSPDLGRGGYCDRLEIGQPAVIVEGQMDAIRLIQAGVSNVIAMGGAKISEDIGKLLRAHNISRVTYVPDVEYNDKGERKTDITNAAIAAFKEIQADGEPVISNLYVSELETPEGANLNGLKIDADTYGKTNGNDALALAVELNEMYWYGWELRQLELWEQTATGWNVEDTFRDRFRKIYRHCNPFERQAIKRTIEGKPLYVKYDVTPSALDEVDEWDRGKDYNNRVKEAHAALTKAIEDGANPVVIADITARLVEAQGTDARDEWNRQLNESFADELEAIKEQPDTLRTKWELGVIRKNHIQPYRKTEQIEFYPADITVFCAPTSHGKTMILFQSALDMVREHPNKTFLYVSCEENKRQLLERALNVYIPIANTDEGKDEQGEYCFISKTRRKTIKAVIREDVAPYEYNPSGYGTIYDKSEHYSAIEPRIKGYIRQYGQQVRPRLKLIHTDATAESICANIKRYIREAQDRGEQVGAVFVDYMQLLSTDSRQYSRHDELKSICRTLRDCAAATELPVIIAAQLNREVLRDGIDKITVANIGEGADIERIAHDVFLVWQVDKTSLGLYADTGKGEDVTSTELKSNVTTIVNPKNVGIRANRILARTNVVNPNERTLKAGYLYVEHLKARDGETGGWGLFPYDGESGRIGENDKEKMAE